jgi:hypothetical protein
LAKIARAQPDGSAVVVGISSPFSETHDGHTGVLPGDTIQQVITDGRDDARLDVLQRLSAALHRGGRVILLVATRPLNFDVDLRCDGEDWFKLGVTVTIERLHQDRIKIQAVNDVGLVPEWNRRNPLCQVMPGDWITHVNQEGKNNAQEMANRIFDCHKDETIWLGIQTRPRVKPGAARDANVNGTQRKMTKMPQIDRAPTKDWIQARHDLPLRQKDEV